MNLVKLPTGAMIDPREVIYMFRSASNQVVIGLRGESPKTLKFNMGETKFDSWVAALKGYDHTLDIDNKKNTVMTKDEFFDEYYQNGRNDERMLIIEWLLDAYPNNADITQAIESLAHLPKEISDD